MMKRLSFVTFLVALAAIAAPAQIRDNTKCPAPIYGAREVTRRAKIIEGPRLSIIKRSVEPNARGRVIIEAVLCRSGRVTDIRIIQGLSPAINEFIVAAMSLVRFTPAEHAWHSVSQRIRFEIEFGPNEPGIKVKTSAEAAGRTVESVGIIGHRRLTTNQILSWIRTKPGEEFSFEQVSQDFQSMLATGYFDKTQTRVTAEDGVRGGVVVIFEVVELPVIGELKFEGLKIDRSVFIEALNKAGLDLQPGAPYKGEALKAVRVIKQLLDSLGHSNAQVEIRIEHVSAQTANVIFVITSHQ